MIPAKAQNGLKNKRNKNNNYDSSLVYYTKRVTDEYVLFTGSTLEGGDYYEREGCNGDLYINATFINTGTLRVGDGSTEKFYANVDNPEVRLAGFLVDENTIESKDFVGEEGLGDLVEDGIFIWDVDAVTALFDE